MKRIIRNFVFIFSLLSIFALSACGKSELSGIINTEKNMTIEAKNASKEGFFMTGDLEVDEGEQIVINSSLEKGIIKIEIVRKEDDGDIDVLPDFDSEPIITMNASGMDKQSCTVPPGDYMVRGTCLEKSTGTVTIEIKHS